MSTPQDSAAREHGQGRKENSRDANGGLRPDEEWDGPFIALCRWFRENSIWFFPITVTVSFGLGVADLFGFARFIGRTDIFISSFEYGPDLVVLALCFMVICALLFPVFFVWLYFRVSELKKLVEDRVSMKEMIFLLFGFVVNCAGFSGLVHCFISYEWPWCWIFIPLVLFAPILFRFSNWCKCRNNEKKISLWRVVVDVIRVAGVVIIFAALFVSMSSGSGGLETFLVWLFSSEFLLLPFLAFYGSEGRAYIVGPSPPRVGRLSFPV